MMKRINLILGCLFIFLAGPACAEKYALLVGIDTYSWPNTPLDGCVKDVAMIQTVLTEKYGFPASNVKTLLNSAATFEGIRNAFQTHLIEQARRGDAVVLYYSGHGTQTPDNNGDEADGIDETLCPVNISDDETTWLTDDILNRWLSQLRTTQVTVILDSCFAGTATRDGSNGKYISKYLSLGFDFSQRKLVKTNLHDPELGHVLLAASSPEQTSLQIPKTGSVFTMLLVELLTNAAADVTYQFIIDEIAPAVSHLIDEHFPDSPQTPQAEGDLTRIAFAESQTTPETPATPAPPAIPAPPAAAQPAAAAPPASESVQYHDFPLRISTNAREYQENDLMVVTVEAERDCYLALYIINAKQAVTQIFPNKWQQNNFIKAGEAVQIPPPGAAFRFRMTGPFGTETLKVDVSTVQFPDLKQTDWNKQTFMEFGHLPLSKLNTRGVSVEATPEVERSQAVLRYDVRQR